MNSKSQFKGEGGAMVDSMSASFKTLPGSAHPCGDDRDTHELSLAPQRQSGMDKAVLYTLHAAARTRT